MDNIYCISRFNNNNTCIEHNDTIAVFSFPKRIWAIIWQQIVYIGHFEEYKLALPYKWWYLTTLAPARTLLNCNGITPTSPFFGFLSFEVFLTAQNGQFTLPGIGLVTAWRIAVEYLFRLPLKWGRGWIWKPCLQQ